MPLPQEDHDAVMRIIGEVLVEVGQAILSRLEAPVAPAPKVGELRLASVRAFARAKGLSEGTVRTWIEAGMPTVPAKRGVRVNVPAAEEWIRAGGASLAKTARRSRRP